MIGPEEFLQSFAVEKKLAVSCCLQCNKLTFFSVTWLLCVTKYLKLYTHTQTHCFNRLFPGRLASCPLTFFLIINSSFPVNKKSTNSKTAGLVLLSYCWWIFYLLEMSCLLFVYMLQGTTKDTWRTKNIDFYIQWYNRLSSFVATEICVVSIIIYRFTLGNMASVVKGSSL